MPCCNRQAGWIAAISAPFAWPTNRVAEATSANGSIGAANAARDMTRRLTIVHHASRPRGGIKGQPRVRCARITTISAAAIRAAARDDARSKSPPARRAIPAISNLANACVAGICRSHMSSLSCPRRLGTQFRNQPILHLSQHARPQRQCPLGSAAGARELHLQGHSASFCPALKTNAKCRSWSPMCTKTCQANR